MRGLRFHADGAREPLESLAGVLAALVGRRAEMAARPVGDILDLLDDFSGRLLRDPATKGLEGAMFLAAWLRRPNLEKMLALNLGGRVDALDGFVSQGRDYLAAKPRGLVAMWMAGNVPTLPAFSFVPALLAKNVALVKLADPEPAGMDAILRVLAESGSARLRGVDLVEALAVVYFPSSEGDLGEAMSAAADAKVVWGGEEAVRAIRALPQQPHCVNVEFGPKYSIGVIDRRRRADPDALRETVAAFVRDVAIFDQRACSSPQTIFVERAPGAPLRRVGELFAEEFAKLPPKPDLDAYSTLRILNARAEWALDEERDVIASQDGANWTVCMDGEVSLKEAVQSRTVFLTEVDSWEQVAALITPKVQTVGIAFADEKDAIAFAERATLAGAARCVRPGLMNVHESPWDGKLLAGELVRWTTLKP